MKYRLIGAETAQHPVSLLCSVLGVSRAGYYAWARRRPSGRARADARLIARIRAIHERSRGTYGAPRVHAQLRHEGVRVGRKRVERLMRETGLSGLIRRRRGKTTIRVRGVRTAPDLVRRDFNPTELNRLWSADLTYIRTWEGWLYLASVMDCYSRRIVGWSMADHLRAQLVVDALGMAVARRRPDRGLVHHSDQGSQYTSLVFTQRCRAVGVEVSMGSRGDCFDNAILESFHATIKKDLIHRRSWPTKADARTAVFDYIETFYNRERLHSTLGMLSPEQYENRTLSHSRASLAASRLAHTNKTIFNSTTPTPKAA
jgi:putative transposase